MIRWICPPKCMSLIYYNNSLQLVTLFFTFLATISSSANCRAKCLNKGICHSNTVCYCTDDFIGAQCEIPVRKFWDIFFFFVKIKFIYLFNWFAKYFMISIINKVICKTLNRSFISLAKTKFMNQEAHKSTHNFLCFYLIL